VNRLGGWQELVRVKPSAPHNRGTTRPRDWEMIDPTIT
jgi:hypothetical protein